VLATSYIVLLVMACALLLLAAGYMAYRLYRR